MPAFAERISEVAKLNRSKKTKYAVHSRVKRWETTDLGKVRGFHPNYENLSPKKLLFVKNSHYLAGIEHIINNEKLCEEYSFHYKYSGPDGTKNQTGRGFYGEMSYKGKTFEGFFHVAIGEDNCMFHAMFEEPTGIISPQTLCKKLEFIEEGGDDGWEVTIKCAFGVRPEDKAIVMEKGEAKDRVTYYFKPLLRPGSSKFRS